MQVRNPWLCLAIVAILGTVAVVGTAGIVLLSLYGHDAPQSLVSVVSTTVGALAAFLVSPPAGSVGAGGS